MGSPRKTPSRVAASLVKLLSAAGLLIAFVSFAPRSRAVVQPLPGTNTAVGVAPAVVLALDISGSLKTCDGGQYFPLQHKLSIYNPRTHMASTNGTNSFATGEGNGDCDCTQPGSGVPILAGGNGNNGNNNGNGNNGNGNGNGNGWNGNGNNNNNNNNGGGGLACRTDNDVTGYPLSRFEMMKVAIADVLDANGDGVINATDESTLRVQMGLNTFKDGSGGGGAGQQALENEYQLDLSTANYKPIGSSYSSIWRSVAGLNDPTGTPHGPFIAGVRALGTLPCYDGTKNETAPVTCALPANEMDPVTGDDLQVSCRQYYMLFITDGESNQGNGQAGGDAIADDGIITSRRIALMNTAYANEISKLNTNLGTGTGNHVKDKAVKPIVIGLGDLASGGKSGSAQVNCEAFWGAAGIAGNGPDANRDSDSNPATMHYGNNMTTVDPNNTSLSAGPYCNTCANFQTGGCNQTGTLSSQGSFSLATKTLAFKGNAYLAQDSTQLKNAVNSALTSTAYGTFSGSEPSLSIKGFGTATGTAVYDAFFDVAATALDWRGHLRKYRFDQVNAKYIDCNSTSVTSNPIKPCWDAGGFALITSGGLANYSYDESGIQHTGLVERTWSTRRIFAPNPANIVYDKNIFDEFNVTPAFAQPVNGSPARSILNVVAKLNSYGTFPPNPSSASSFSSSNPELYAWASMSVMADQSNTYAVSPADTTMAVGALTTALQVLYFTAGKPDSTFAGGAPMRCGAACSNSSASPKLGDAYRSRPVIVGPPTGLISDPDYLGEFANRLLTNPAAGSEAVVEGTSGTLAQPCGPSSSGAPQPPNCHVKERRKVVYLGDNDGMVHAFDDTTGAELWAFIPPGHFKNLGTARVGRTTLIDADPVVRDVKFPLDPTKRFTDGKWHTILIYGLGTGGNFYFALDITNPVDPVFLWEYRDPPNMGLTIAKASIGEIVSPNTPTITNPGSAVFVSGGVVPIGGTFSDFYSLTTFNGSRMFRSSIPVLSDSTFALSSNMAAVGVNGLLGEPRPADGNLDGKVDRVYVGDQQGRMWKACNIGADGSFTMSLFFDPALYDNPTGGVGCNLGIGVPCGGANSANPTNGLADAADRRTLRGPIFFAPDVTYDGTGNLQVAFGTGNIFDPTTTASSYQNFLWNLRDNPSPTNSCATASQNICTGSVLNESRYLAPGGHYYNNVRIVHDSLTTAPLFFNKYLLYTEFDIINGAQCSSNSYLSREFAVDMASCGTPAQPPFRDAANNPTNVITYNNELVTGFQIDPSGSLFTMGSVPGGAPPSSTQVPGIAATTSYAGFKQK